MRRIQSTDSSLSSSTSSTDSDDNAQIRQRFRSNINFGNMSQRGLNEYASFVQTQMEVHPNIFHGGFRFHENPTVQNIFGGEAFNNFINSNNYIYGLQHLNDNHVNNNNNFNNLYHNNVILETHNPSRYHMHMYDHILLPQINHNATNIYDDYPHNTPLSDTEINWLKQSIDYEKNSFRLKEGEKSVVCPITQDEIREGYKTKCGHDFSHNGIVGWLRERKETCPICRKKLF